MGLFSSSSKSNSSSSYADIPITQSDVTNPVNVANSRYARTNSDNINLNLKDDNSVNLGKGASINMLDGGAISSAFAGIGNVVDKSIEFGKSVIGVNENVIANAFDYTRRMNEQSLGLGADALKNAFNFGSDAISEIATQTKAVNQAAINQASTALTLLDKTVNTAANSEKSNNQILLIVAALAAIMFLKRA